MRPNHPRATALATTLAVALLFTGLPAAAGEPHPIGLGRLVGGGDEQLRDYCIGPVCLGMTLREVKALPGRIEWQLYKPKDSFNCFAMDSVRGGMTSSSFRGELMLNLLGTDRTGAPEDRYVVNNIALFVTEPNRKKTEDAYRALLAKHNAPAPTDSAGEKAGDAYETAASTVSFGTVKVQAVEDEVTFEAAWSPPKLRSYVAVSGFDWREGSCKKHLETERITPAR